VKEREFPETPGPSLHSNSNRQTGVETEPGRAGQFHFTAQLEVGAPAEHAVPPRAYSLGQAEKKLRVLMAEDNPVNQKLTAKILEKRGHQVVVVGDGREALAALEKETFDVVLMDMQMPEMDGLEATAAIRKKEQSTGAHVPIVAMTANAMPSDQEKCLAAGMDGYLSKPIQAQHFLKVIEGHASPDRKIPDLVTA
jgi:CheY-like chemotaxis protein